MTSGLLDTSVVIDWDDPAVSDQLPDESAICAVTMDELAAGPRLATDPAERARRQARLVQVEAMFEPLPYDVAVTRSYRQLVAAVVADGRGRRPRVADLQIAATAHANRLDLYTRHPDDFRGLGGLVTVVPV